MLYVIIWCISNEDVSNFQQEFSIPSSNQDLKENRKKLQDEILRNDLPGGQCDWQLVLHDVFMYLKKVNRSQKTVLQNFELEEDEIILKNSHFLKDFFKDRKLESV